MANSIFDFSFCFVGIFLKRKDLYKANYSSGWWQVDIPRRVDKNIFSWQSYRQNLKFQCEENLDGFSQEEQIHDNHILPFNIVFGFLW